MSPASGGELIPLLTEVGIDGSEFAVATGIYDFLDEDKWPFSVSLVGKGADFSGLIAGFDTSEHIGGGCSEWFFAQYVEVVLEGLDNLIFVGSVGSRDENGIT